MEILKENGGKFPHTANGRTKAESNIVENENYNIQEIEESRDFKKKRRNGKENQKKLSNGNSV